MLRGDFMRARTRLLGESVTSSGTLRADTASGDAGEIELHAQDKTLLTGNSLTSARSASDGKGGTLKVLGDKVGLFDAATVDVSGAHGGGQVLIGGDYQGNNVAVRNAGRTTIAPDATIYADALEQGDGGQVIVWADEYTRYYGSLRARGGAQEGNGGFAEVSGKEAMVFEGDADLSALAGSGGTLLLDPKNITICADAPTSCETSTPFDDLDEFGDIPDAATILHNTVLAAQLITADVTLRANNDITFAADVTKGTGSDLVHNLALEAGHSITIESGVTIELDGGAFSATVNHQGAQDAHRDAGLAVFNMVGTSSIITNGGNITIQTGEFGGAVNLADNIGDFTLQTLNSSIQTSVSGDAASAGDIAIVNAAGNIVAHGAIRAVGGQGGDDGGAGGNVRLEAATGNLLINNQISSNGGNGGGGSNDDGGNAGDVTLLAGNNLNIYSSVSAVGGSATGNDGGTGGNISIESTAGTIVIGDTVSANGGNGGAYGGDLGGGAGAITIAVSDSVGVGASMTARGGTGSISGTNNTITFNGNASDNTFTFNDNITLAGSMVTVNGGGGNDLLVRGGNAANTWTINGENIGTLAFGNVSGTTTIAFNAIENLTGGAGQDQFTLAVGGNVAGLIDGGGDTDSLTITTAGSQTIELGDRVNTNLNVYQVETLSANAATRNKLIGDNVANTWTLDGTRNGTVYDGAVTTIFTGIDDVTGGTATDGFTLNANFAGLIDGGDGTDSLTIAVGGDRIIELGDRFNTNTNIHRMETLTANAATRNELLGDNVANTWTLDGTRNGTVYDGAVTTIFTRIDDVTGGTATDGFTLNANFAGLIDGGDGTDSLTIAVGGDRIIELGDRFNTNTNIHRMETLTANAAVRNELIGDNVANTWTLDDARNGTVAYGTVTTAFTGIDDVTGGANTDSFTLAGGFAGLIDGGLGSDSLAITSAGNRVIELGDRVNTNTNVYRVESVTANTTTRNGLVGDSDAFVNFWTLSGPRQGTVSDGTTTTIFNNVDDVTGGATIDDFTLAGNFAGLIDGGAGEDVLRIAAAEGAVIELGNQVNNNINAFQVESITGNPDPNASNELIGDSDSGTNIWNINGSGNGTVENDLITTAFSNFDTISGGGSGDDFTVVVSANIANLNGGGGDDIFRVSGTVAGLLDAGGGDDRVNILLGANVGAVQLGDGNDYFNMSYGGSVGNVYGGSGNDSFVVNAGAINGAVYGGDDNDNISIGAAATSLHVDGGAGVDTLSSSKSGFELTLSDFALVTGFSATQVENVSAVDGILNARNGTTNTWDIVGTNSGSVNVTSFNGFATLNGGDNADIFNVSGNGSITGLISGRGGDDSLNIDLAGRTQSGGRINYDGGSQAGDSITITGTADGFSETYRTNQTVAGLLGNFDQLGYTSVGAGLDVNYRDLGRVDDNVVVANLLLENSNAADNVLLGNNTFEIENSIRVGVNYAPGSKADITVTTPSGGIVQLVDNVSLPGTLTVTTGSLLNPDAHTIDAGALVLQNAGAPDVLMTNVGSLQVVNSGPIYIQEQDDLTLAGLDTTDLLDITAGGSIDSSANLVSSAAINLVAGGSIDLSGQTHQLSGRLTLAAGNDISLDNGGLTTLATVSAQNLTLDAIGNIIGDGPVAVGGTSTLTSTGDINLANAANDFDIIDINAAGKVTLRDANNIAGGSLTAGAVELTTVAGVGGSPAARLHTHTADLTINNTSGGVYVQNGRELLVSITNRGDIDLSNNGTVIIDRLYANGSDYSTGQTYAGDVRLTTQNYPVFAKTGDGSHSHTSAPDIVGQNLYVETQASDLGSLGRYMSIRANDNFTFVGARGYVFYYGADPKKIVGTPDLVVFSGIMGLSGQQLIGVESLGDVDEAVFTDVRNYYHEDVAIMLPAHQRMTDDDDDEERRQREAVN
jgi:hypothetical protein